ncbi:MAG: deoxyribonuclease IV [bacterium]|nr:deoxyribonuclease IV [bacterium]
MSTQQLVGAHVSAAGGYEKAVERAAAIGANCVQLFSGSPRVWRRPELAKIDANKVFSFQDKLSVETIFTHSIYLLNMCSENPESVRKTREVLEFDLSFDALLKGHGVVVHVGSHQGRGWEAVREQVVREIATVIEATPESSTFIIENSAGQQGKVLSDLAEIRWVLDQLQSQRVKWCFDTCHGHAAGYALGQHAPAVTEPKLMEKPQRDFTATEEIERLHLEEELACIHVNDSRDPYISGRDRHDNIGDGTIGAENLGYFLNHKVIKGIPLITEVPGLNNEGPDLENMQRIKGLLKHS